MAEVKNKSDQEEEVKEEDFLPKPLSPVQRKRLQTCFEQGSAVAAKGSYDYAHEMFTQCVIGDPSNLAYWQPLMDNLYKKYKHNKKGSSFSGLKSSGANSAIKKALKNHDWGGAAKAAAVMFKANPWDSSTLVSVSDLVEKLQNTEAQVYFLKAALESDMKSAGNNKACAERLVRAGEFDMAIACWHRIKAAKKNDPEPDKMISALMIKKTIHEGGYEGAESSREVKAERTDKGAVSAEKAGLTSAIDRFEQAIRSNPADVNNYLELARAHTRESNYKQAQEVLNRAMDASGGDINVREALENVDLQQAQEIMALAERRYLKEKSPENEKVYKAHKSRLINIEIDYYRTRIDRYPSNHGLKYELGARMKKLQKYKEAIDLFQQASKDKTRRAQADLELGECFQHIKRYNLAMASYEESIQAALQQDEDVIKERDVETLKGALYRAGRLAMGLATAGDQLDGAQLDKAEKYLSELASMDFNYRDIGERLDKIARLRDKG